MPRLQLETHLLPEDLFLHSCEEMAVSSRWWVMHTKPRGEKSLARRLCALERSFFLPLHQHKAIRRGKVCSSYLPLFPGYLFFFGSEDERVQVLKTKMVVQSLEVKDQVQLHQDLQNVYRLMNSGEGLTPEHRLEPGKPVEIIHGPLKGMEGRVIRRENRMRFLIEVRLLQRGVSVEMESWMLTPTESVTTSRAGREHVGLG